MIRITLQCDCGSTGRFPNATAARHAGWIVGDLIRRPACPAPVLGQVEGEPVDPPSMVDPRDDWRS